MKLLKALKCDLNKTIINAGFWISTLITCMLCFTANVYKDMSIEKTYSVFEAIFTLDKGVILSDYSFASIIIFQKALTGYITMFIPIIVAFPFMISFCAERNNGLMRFTITRTGKNKYYLSKFFSSIISGGLAVAIGVLIFGMMSFIIFPSLESYNLPTEDLSWILQDTSFMITIKMILSAFLVGAISTLPAFFLSSFCRNPYLITCLPFMFNYIWTTGLSKLYAKGLEEGNYDIYEKLEPFYPTSISNIVSWQEFGEVAKKTLVFNAGYVVVLLVGFILIMNRRIDKGV